jgi:hypothetical protein
MSPDWAWEFFSSCPKLKCYEEGNHYTRMQFYKKFEINDEILSTFEYFKFLSSGIFFLEWDIIIY